MEGTIEQIRKAVNARHVACGRVWLVEEEEVPCVECGKDLDEAGHCDFCGYQDERAEQGDVLPRHPDSPF